MKRNLGPEWLKNAIFYQIYPSSFYDSNGDGMGDLAGIIAKLDILVELGVNAIWLNPCFQSPFGDGGYDVADYRRVDARFGTDADLEHLFRAARERGLKVCLDMVAGHTSVEHHWFQMSSRPEKNAYSNYYIWNEDWLAPTDGLPMISGIAARNGSFMINYFAMQPALNYGFADPDPRYPWQLPVDHPDVLKVREELKNNFRYWLDRGADGFRVDMACSLVKRDPRHRATMALWREVRAMFDDEYPEAALISEWTYAPQALKAGFHCDFMLHCGTPAYTSLLRCEPERDIFHAVDKKLFYENDGHDYRLKNPHSYFDPAGLGDAKVFFDIYEDHYRRTRNYGYISLPTGNHDMPRFSDGRDERDLKVFFTFLLTMPGVPFIYYGDEIGMRNLKHLPSREGGFTRTQARTPMQWDDSGNAGFSTAPADRLYLPVDSDLRRPTVAEQRGRPDSLWNQVRCLAALRHSARALGADGGFELLLADYPLVYVRRYGAERFLVVIQPARKAWTCTLAVPADWGALESVYDGGARGGLTARSLVLEGAGTDAGVWRVRPARKIPKS